MIDGGRVMQAFMVLWASGCAAAINASTQATGNTLSPDLFEPLTWALYEQGRTQSATNYLMSLTYLQSIARSVARFFDDYDVLLTPTLGEPPVPLGSFDSREDDPLYGLTRAARFVPFTPMFNVTGQPAMSVPLYWNGEGLPIGTHFVARFGDEATLFRLASQLEQARPWAGRRPPEDTE